jgi:hypothetical protein
MKESSIAVNSETGSIDDPGASWLGKPEHRKKLNFFIA